MMKVSLIAAIGPMRELGLCNDLPWRLGDDLKNFKAITLGHHLVMGRKTFAAVGKPLPGRTTLVVSRTLHAAPPGTFLFSSIPAALEFAKKQGEAEAFICGGRDIFAQCLPVAQRFYLTEVEYSGAADVWFPEYTGYPWSVVERRERKQDPSGLWWTFTILEKAPEAC